MFTTYISTNLEEYDLLLERSLPILPNWAGFNDLWNRSSKIPIPRKARQLERSRHTNSFPKDSGSLRTAESNYPTNDPYEQCGLHQEILKSLPKQQYKDEIEEEKKRLLKAGKWPGAHSSLDAQAEGNIKRCWTEQGIWSDNWKNAKVWRWKHEEQLDWESDREIGVRKTANQKRRIDARRAKLKHDREASRPIYQFWYQLLRE
ncbi:hypothetical protein B0O99DRAFT_737198 [Bisporella sp. PMI_857]|nr:hypothetical protein B0O99DRAFT_737866 [Bisporella sp. PMI_857]KAH8600404.1 hypothetical protein B0O99DRAFT_737198 [Bisporella sp. PMI_857]